MPDKANSPNPLPMIFAESSLSAGLEADEAEEDPSADPFIVQERIFSKYAAMLYSSDNNAKTFHEFKDAKFCPSCGEKVDVYISYQNIPF